VPNENTTPATGFAPGDPGVQQIGQSYWLAGRQQPAVALRTPFDQDRVAPETPAPDGVQAGFNGDYSGLAVSGNTAFPIWSDTRNAAVQTSPSQGVVHDEDVFADSRAIPRGNNGRSGSDNDRDDDSQAD